MLPDFQSKCRLIISVVIFMPLLTSAEDAPKEARDLFAEGKEAFAATDYEKAAALFKKANELKPSWKLLFNIGQSEAAAKRYGLALEAFESYLSQGGDEVESDRSAEVVKEINRLRMLVGTVALDAPAGTELYINDVLRGTAPLRSTVRTAVGRQNVRLVLDGNELLNEEIKFSGGVSTEIAVEDQDDGTVPTTAGAETVPEPADTASSSPTTEKTKPGAAPLEIAGWSTLGVGGATLIGGVAIGAMALAKEKDLAKRCPNRQCEDPDDNPEIESIQTLADVSTFLYAVGGTVTAAGITMLIVGKMKKTESSSVSLAPVFTQDVQGIVLNGSF